MNQQVAKILSKRAHPAMCAENMVKDAEQFVAGWNALFLHVLEKGKSALEMKAPELFGSQFRSGWDNATMLIRDLGVSEHVPFSLAVPKK
jgi:hypothetical protein